MAYVNKVGCRRIECVVITYVHMSNHQTMQSNSVNIGTVLHNSVYMYMYIPKYVRMHSLDKLLSEFLDFLYGEFLELGIDGLMHLSSRYLPVIDLLLTVQL